MTLWKTGKWIEELFKSFLTTGCDCTLSQNEMMWLSNSCSCLKPQVLKYNEGSWFIWFDYGEWEMNLVRGPETDWKVVFEERVDSASQACSQSSSASMLPMWLLLTNTKEKWKPEIFYIC